MNAPATCNQQDAGANSIHKRTMNEATVPVPPTRHQIKLSEKDIARFWAKVNKDGPTQPHMDTPCWLWTGAKGYGYGQFWVAGKLLKAHRVAWFIANSHISNDFACHHCDNPTCIRADHLFLGTHSDNMRDMTTKGRNGSHTKPERLARGDRNGYRLYPERIRRGNTHHSQTKPECVARGEACRSAKLTASNIIEIRLLASAGTLTQKAIAEQYGVTRALINLIVNRRIWKHIA